MQLTGERNAPAAAALSAPHLRHLLNLPLPAPRERGLPAREEAAALSAPYPLGPLLLPVLRAVGSVSR